MTVTHLSTGEVARRVSESVGHRVFTYQVARLYERGEVPDVPTVGGRRAIPETDLPVIIAAMRKRGWIPAEEPANA